MRRRKSSGWLHNAAPSEAGNSGVLRARGAAGLDFMAARAWLALAGLLAACGGAPPTPEGSQTVNIAGGVATAIAAGVLWAAGGGCKLQGCPYGSFCDRPSGFCKVRRCSEGEGCPEGTICNEGLDRCQAPPPPNPPNDFLPEDNLLQRPL